MTESSCQSIPFTIVTGFLGSGKTTLINRLLSEDHGVRFAVIVNEFGEIGLDAALLTGTQDFVEMNNGCLCCALNEDLVKLLHRLRVRGGFDAVVLETTGIADPLPIAWAFLKDEMAGAFRFAGIVTVVDALHLEDMLTQAAEARQQIERADYLYLAKTEFCDEKDRVGVMGRLSDLNALARVVDSREASALQLIFATDDFAAAPMTLSLGGAHHQPDFDSLCVDLMGKHLDLESMEDFFERLPTSVFRAKAVFDDTQGHAYVMHAVCGRVDFADAPVQSQVRAAVFIGRRLKKEKLLQDLLRLASI